MTTATGRPVVLMYHRVHDAVVDPWGLCVSPANFDSQLSALTTQCDLIPLRAVTEQPSDLPDRPVVVTFDDGYVDNHSQALPLLQAHGAPATVFVATAHIDQPGEFWWDRLEAALLTPGTLPERLVLDLPSGTRTWDLGEAVTYTPAQREADRRRRPGQASPGERLHLFFELYNALWPWLSPLRERVLETLLAWSGAADADPGRRTLTSAELRDLADAGIEIGGHTVDHPPLTQHAAAEQRYQVQGGKLRLEGLLDREISSFAYPHGLFDGSAVDAVQRAGFSSAVTTQARPASKDDGHLLLPRFAVPDVPGEALLASVEGWWSGP